MIHYIRHKDIDFNKWDACIDEAANGIIYGYSWYLDAACEQWDALVEGDYEMVMPLPYRRKMGVSYVFPPTMTQQLGVFGRSLPTTEKVKEFIAQIPSKFKYCEINLNHGNPMEADAYHASVHTNLELDLSRPYEELHAAFSENTRRNLRKSEHVKIRVWKKGNIRNLLQLFKNTKAGEIKTLPDDFYKVVEKVGKLLIERGQAEIWEVSVNVDLCAGVLFAFSHNKAYFLFSAATSAAKENNIMHYLIDKFIKEHAGQDKVLDFEGSDNKNLARFYKSFGATEKNYQKIMVNRLPGALLSLVRKIRKK